MRYPARFVSELPSVFSVGGVQLTVAVPLDSANTDRLNAGSETTAVPSDTEIVMLVKLRMSSRPGVPDSLPVAVLNVAQDGRFWMLNVSALPSGSVALG